MNTISAKHVVLGVTGSIAAYKACEIASTLTKAGVKVTPVMTRSAQQLVGPATFEGLIAPATANILGKAAYGIADDWLTTALLATPAPILFAPAMNSNMYAHPAVQENIVTLKKRGCQFIGPASGLLACKTDGPGRMVEAEEIVDTVWSILGRSDDLAGSSQQGPTMNPSIPFGISGIAPPGKWDSPLRKKHSHAVPKYP